MFFGRDEPDVHATPVFDWPKIQRNVELVCCGFQILADLTLVFIGSKRDIGPIARLSAGGFKRVAKHGPLLTMELLNEPSQEEEHRVSPGRIIRMDD